MKVVPFDFEILLRFVRVYIDATWHSCRLSDAPNYCKYTCISGSGRIAWVLVSIYIKLFERVGACGHTMTFIKPMMTTEEVFSCIMHDLVEFYGHRTPSHSESKNT